MSDELNTETQTGDAPNEVASETVKSSGDEFAPATESKPDTAAELDAQKQKGVDKRISNLTRRVKEAEAQLQLERSMRQQELSRVNYANGHTNAESQGLPKPSRSQFPDAHDYAEELLRWENESRSLQLKQHQQQSSAAQVANFKRNLNDQHNLRADELRKTVPDFDTAMKTLDGFLPESHIIAIQKSSRSAEIAYQLAKNMDDAQDFALLDPFDAAIRIGELTVELKNKPAGNAHKPMGSVQTSNASSASPGSTQSRISAIRKRVNKRNS